MDATTFWYLAGLALVVSVTVGLVVALNFRWKRNVDIPIEPPDDWESVMPREKRRPEPSDRDQSNRIPSFRRVGVKQKRSDQKRAYATLAKGSR